MKAAVINEVSASHRNQDILDALQLQNSIEIFNVGMKAPDDGEPLTYIQTGLMAGILLNTGACDMVIGGCGTGQGFLNAAMQMPGVFCGLILEPLDAWLFSQINGGNCISLALNKGYGWAGNINLEYIFEKLFKDKPGAGYPRERSESQGKSRETLAHMSALCHRTVTDIIHTMDDSILKPIAFRDTFMDLLAAQAQTDSQAGQIYQRLLKIKS